MTRYDRLEGLGPNRTKRAESAGVLKEEGYEMVIMALEEGTLLRVRVIHQVYVNARKF